MLGDSGYMLALKLLMLKDKHNLKDRAYISILATVQDHFNLEPLSFYTVKNRLFQNFPCQPKFYDCCETGCIAYVGEYKESQQCKFCNKSRYRNHGLQSKKGKKIANKQFPVFSITKALQTQFLSEDRTNILQYRSRFKPDSECFDDVFGGSLYLDAKEKFKIEDNDIILSAATDGYQIIKM